MLILLKAFLSFSPMGINAMQFG